MSDQQFCLKWNNYSTSVTAVFRELLEKEQMCDVTLATKEKSIKAHRIVLTACSTFFKNIFQDVQPWQHSVVFMKDVKYNDLAGIIEFIYHGEVSVDQPNLSSFLLAAESLKIKGLTEDSKRTPPPHNNVDQQPVNTSTPRAKIETNPHQQLIQQQHQQQQQQLSQLLQEDGEEVKELAMNQFQMDEGEEEEEEEEALTEEEMRNSSLEIMMDNHMDKLQLEGEEMLNQSPGIDPTALSGSSNQLLAGSKKTCPYCYQQLSWHALSRHIRDMHKAKTDLVNCKYCFKTFRNKNSLGCHIWRFHKRGREPKTAAAAASPVFAPAATLS